MNCLAVDDEPLALDLLEDNIRKIPFLHYLGNCANAFEALKVLQEQKVDLVFLDIQMPGITGIQFLQGLAQPPMVIFITAYKQYALEGFNLNIVDYLLKPVPFERFLRAVNKAHDWHRLLQLSAQPPAPAAEAAPASPYLFVQAEYSLLKLRLADIEYVEGLKDYVKIYLAGQTRPVLTRLTMKAMEEKLPAQGFVRVHKSFIVSMDRIELVRNQKIKVGEKFIPLSDGHSGPFFARIAPEKRG
jgi:DNA-binding LytR/AlgR family response regulator